MATVCEVCYQCEPSEDLLLDIQKEERNGKNIVHILHLHLQFLILDCIENPQICLDCWRTLENFHQFYGSIEELHRPQPDSASDSDADDNDDVSSVLVQSGLENVQLPLSKSEPPDGPDDTNETDDGEEIETMDESVNEELQPIAIDDTDDDYDRETVPAISKMDSDLIEFYGPLFCEICDAQQVEAGLPLLEYRTFGKFKRHLVECHGRKKAFLKCPLCSKRSNSRPKLWQHMEMHRNPDKFCCHICAEVHQDLDEHIKHKHLTLTHRFKCTECDRWYSSNARLLMHTKLSHAPKDITCTVCNKQFSKYCIKQHVRSFHSNPEFMCEQCGKPFRTTALLHRHQEQHLAQTGSAKTVSCSVCKQSVRSNYITRHMRQMHSETPPVICGECGKSFRSMRSLNQHLAGTCPGQRLHCPSCIRSFKTAAKLAEHMATHKAKGLYMCSTCGEKFDTKFLLLDHRPQCIK